MKNKEKTWERAESVGSKHMCYKTDNELQHVVKQPLTSENYTLALFYSNFEDNFSPYFGWVVHVQDHFNDDHFHCTQ